MYFNFDFCALFEGSVLWKLCLSRLTCQDSLVNYLGVVLSPHFIVWSWKQTLKLVFTQFIWIFSESAQWFCPFSNIPLAWCVMSHLLRQVWPGKYSQCYWLWKHIMFVCFWPLGGNETNIFCAVMAAFCIHFFPPQMFSLFKMWIIGEHGLVLSFDNKARVLK